MAKEYPNSFNDLVQQFNSLDDSDEDYYEEEWDEEGLNYKVIEYPGADCYDDDFRILFYQNNYYRCGFDGHCIEGYINKELYEKHEGAYFDITSCSGEWIEVIKDLDEGVVPKGNYYFSIPSIVKLLDGGKQKNNELISEDNEIITDWIIDMEEEDFKNIIYGVYGFGREVLFDKGFLINYRYNG